MKLQTNFVAGLVLLLFALTVRAAGIDQKYPDVRQYFPTATRFGELTGTPPAAAVYKGNDTIGYVFETKTVAPVPAYSGQPINVLVAIDHDGKILGTRVLEQHEPILLVGISVQKLYDFVARYIGHRVTDDIVVGGGGGKGSVNIDAISGATVTAMVTNETIMDSALKIALSRNIVSAAALNGIAAKARVRMDYFKPATWQSLTGNGAIRHLKVTRAMVAKAFVGQPKSAVLDDTTEVPSGHEGDTFVDLYYADITPPTVGRNLLGKSAYNDLMHRLAPGEEAIAVMGNGIYSFKGVGYVRGGIFDRVHVMQENKLMLFHDSDYQRLLDTQLKDMPSFQEMAIFIIRHGYDFDPGRPWTLQLLVRRQIGPVKSIYTTFTGSYQIPAKYVVRPAPPSAQELQRLKMGGSTKLWVKIWQRRYLDIIILSASLVLLTFILTFQDWLVRRPVLLERIRVGFLIYTVVFIGWYELAQLSVVNIFAFIGSLLHGFHWSTFLMDPLIFILWGFVAVTLLLVGRGVYCGWLCPFGALQTLISKAAQYLRVPQLELPSFVHERLWAVKYIVLLALFGLSLQSLNTAERYAEIEPFKTAIDLHFMRSWPFIVYAVGLLLASAFNSKFFCKYMCPLGAGLAVAGRHRLFEWLRRRRECGRPCQTCAHECEVQAINPIGQINYNECHYCLDCQVTYWNDHKCPPLVERRKRMERRLNRRKAPKTQEAVEVTFARTPGGGD
jgi:NosR/NirI family nitrous oxide reductase transcriptional regulator